MTNYEKFKKRWMKSVVSSWKHHKEKMKFLEYMKQPGIFTEEIERKISEDPECQPYIKLIERMREEDPPVQLVWDREL